VTGGSKLKSVLIFLHMAKPPGAVPLDASAFRIQTELLSARKSCMPAITNAGVLGTSAPCFALEIRHINLS
jgi:hypothetical protein